MNTKKFSDALGNIGENYVEEAVTYNKKKKNTWVKWISIAACLMLILGAAIIVPMLQKKNPGIIPNPEIPIVNVRAPSSAPQYYGTESSESPSGGGSMEVNPQGISVTAKLIETLPDTYTFFDDWRQTEFRLLKMKTVRLLAGMGITEEFYYLVPAGFISDLSAYDCFVIRNMAQFGYDYSVMYNETQKSAEQFHLALFGYRTYGYDTLGEEFLPFDAGGRFDGSLWDSCEAWRSVTQYASRPKTLAEAESEARKEENGRKNHLYVHLLGDISGEAADLLSKACSFDEGIFVPAFSSFILHFSPEVQFHATRYIGGFATNEMVNVWDKGWTGGDEDTYEWTKARFTDEDLTRLPDLSSAFEAVKNAMNVTVIPPHLTDLSKMKSGTDGIFGWYAKTGDGVIGIVRVTWCYFAKNYQRYYDDAYYVIEYGSDVCHPIDRDDLLAELGEYETTYIYTGGYDENGKVSVYYYAVEYGSDVCYPADRDDLLAELGEYETTDICTGGHDESGKVS